LLQSKRVEKESLKIKTIAEVIKTDIHIRISHLLNKFLVLILISAVVFLITSAKIPDKLRTLNKKLQERKYEAVLILKLYSEKSKTKLLEEKQMEMKIWEGNLYYKAENIEAFANKNYNIIIYHERKIIVINKADPNFAKSTIKEPIQNLIDSLSSSIYSIKLVNQNANIYTYLIKESEQSDEDSYDHVIYSINATEFKPKSFEIYYNSDLNQLLGSIKKSYNKNEKPVLVATYTKFNYLTSYKEADFNFSRVLSLDKKGKHVLKPEYSDYKVMNYLDIKRRRR